jgi:phosphohistidine phosphatase
MNLYLMQHGACLPQEVKANQPLTPVGHDQIVSAARAMKIMGLWFDALLASPFHPAMQTASLVAEGLGYAQSSVTSFEALRAHTGLKTCMEELRQAERFQSVLLCGEMPLLGGLASHLLSSGPRLSLALEGGALLALGVNNLNARNASLRWLLQPGQLQMIAAG